MTNKKFRYRKVTPQIKKQIRHLRKKGHTFSEIAKKFKVAIQTVSYHSSEKHRVKVIERVKRNNAKQFAITGKKKYNRNRLGYNKQYQKERYDTDEEFKKYFIKKVAECSKQRRAERKRKGLCAYCGKKKSADFIMCKRCREKAKHAKQ